MFPPSAPALSTPPFFTISTPPQQQQQMSCESNAFGAERTQHAVLKINACVSVCVFYYRCFVRSNVCRK